MYRMELTNVIELFIFNWQWSLTCWIHRYCRHATRIFHWAMDISRISCCFLRQLKHKQINQIIKLMCTCTTIICVRWDQNGYRLIDHLVVKSEITIISYMVYIFIGKKFKIINSEVSRNSKNKMLKVQDTYFRMNPRLHDTRSRESCFWSWISRNNFWTLTLYSYREPNLQLDDCILLKVLYRSTFIILISTAHLTNRRFGF